MVVKINGLTYRYHSGKKSGYMGHGAIKWETTMFLREAIGKDKEPTSLHSQFLSKLNMKHTSTFRFKKKNYVHVYRFSLEHFCVVNAQPLSGYFPRCAARKPAYV